MYMYTYIYKYIYHIYTHQVIEAELLPQRSPLLTRNCRACKFIHLKKSRCMCVIVSEMWVCVWACVCVCTRSSTLKSLKSKEHSHSIANVHTAECSHTSIATVHTAECSHTSIATVHTSIFSCMYSGYTRQLYIQWLNSYVQ